MLRTLLAAALLTLAPPPPDSEVVVELADGSTRAGVWRGLQGSEFLLAGPDGAEQAIAAADLVLLHSAAQPAPPRSPPVPEIEPTHLPPLPVADVLLLAGDEGDVLVGRVIGGDEYGLRFRLDAGADLDIPYDLVARLLPSARLPLDRLAALAGGGKDDRLWFQRADGGLDTLTGVVERVTDGKVEFEGALGRRDFPLADVVAVVLGAAQAEPAAPLAGLPVVVRLAGGSRLHAGLTGLDGRRAALASRVAPRLELPLSSILALVSLGPGRTLLADLPPAAVDEHPSIGGAADVLFPWRRNLSVSGRPLVLGGVPSPTGLGVHATSRLSFDLPAGSRTLRVTAGVCDEVLELPADASVDFQVLVDGRVAASARVTEGQPPVDLRVDLTGGRRLVLLAGHGGDDDAGDRAAWVDGVLFAGEY